MKALVSAALMAAFFVSTAQAQDQKCFPYPDFKAASESDGAEVVVSGNSLKGHILEIWHKDGAWIAIVRLPSGLACAIDFGANLSTAPAFNPAANNSL